MKKWLGTFCLLLGISTSQLSAQVLHIGIKSGANLGKISGQSFKDKFQLSYQAGGYMEIDSRNGWGIQPEVLFSQTAAETTSQLDWPDTQQKLNYLSIPLLLRLNPNSLITINAGPQYSILLNKDKNVLQNGKEAFKSGDFSLIGGLQLNIRGCRIYGRYVIGLSDINDVTNDIKWKNQNIQMGLCFNLF